MRKPQECKENLFIDRASTGLAFECYERDR